MFWSLHQLMRSCHNKFRLFQLSRSPLLILLLILQNSLVFLQFYNPFSVLILTFFQVFLPSCQFPFEEFQFGVFLEEFVAHGLEDLNLITNGSINSVPFVVLDLVFRFIPRMVVQHGRETSSADSFSRGFSNYMGIGRLPS